MSWEEEGRGTPKTNRNMVYRPVQTYSAKLQAPKPKPKPKLDKDGKEIEGEEEEEQEEEEEEDEDEDAVVVVMDDYPPLLDVEKAKVETKYFDKIDYTPQKIVLPPVRDTGGVTCLASSSSGSLVACGTQVGVSVG